MWQLYRSFLKPSNSLEVHRQGSALNFHMSVRLSNDHTIGILYPPVLTNEVGSATGSVGFLKSDETRSRRSFSVAFAGHSCKYDCSTAMHHFKADALLHNGGSRLFSSVAQLSLSGNEGGQTADKETEEKVVELIQNWGPDTPKRLEDLQLKLDPYMVCRILKQKMKQDSAWQFFKWAKIQKDFYHNTYTYTALIDQLGRARNFLMIESVLEEMKKEGCELNVVTFTTLIHWNREAKNLDAVRRFWKQMHDQNCRPNVVAFTTCIDALAKGGCHQEAMEVYKEMQSVGCRPNVFTFTVLIHSLTQAGKLDAAAEIFEKLGEVNVRPNRITYSLLIGAHAKASRVEQALSFYKRMRESGLNTSFETRSVLARALEASGRNIEARQILTDDVRLLQQIQLQPGVVQTKPPGSGRRVGNQKPKKDDGTSSNSTLDQLPKPTKLAEMLKTWGSDTEKLLESLGPRLRPPYVLNVLKLLTREGYVAWRFYEWTRAQDGFVHTQYIYTKIMDIIGHATEAGNYELIEKVLTEIERDQEKTTQTFNNLIKSLVENKHTEAALQVFSRMKRLGFEPNEVTYTLLIDVLSRVLKHKEAMEIYEEMKRADCMPTLQTYTVLIRSLASAGRLDDAKKLFKKMPSSGLKPNVVTYTVMMHVLSKAGETDKVIEVYNQMKEAKIKPTRVTLKVLAKSLRRAGMTDEADALSASMPYVGLSEEEVMVISTPAEKAVHDIMMSNFTKKQHSEPVLAHSQT
jgi:pentatricopeptide repeat protein